MNRFSLFLEKIEKIIKDGHSIKEGSNYGLSKKKYIVISSLRNPKIDSIEVNESSFSFVF